MPVPGVPEGEPRPRRSVPGSAEGAVVSADESSDVAKARGDGFTVKVALDELTATGWLLYAESAGRTPSTGTMVAPLAPGSDA